MASAGRHALLTAHQVSVGRFSFPSTAATCTWGLLAAGLSTWGVSQGRSATCAATCAASARTRGEGWWGGPQQLGRRQGSEALGWPQRPGAGQWGAGGGGFGSQLSAGSGTQGPAPVPGE